MFLIVLVSLFVLPGCTEGSKNGKTKTLETFYQDQKIDNIDQIIIQDGSTGASKMITKQPEIEEFLSLIRDVKFTPQDNQEERVGWRYGITLIDGDCEFTFSLHHIDNTYYDSNPDIFPIVDNYYKQLDLAEE